MKMTTFDEVICSKSPDLDNTLLTDNLKTQITGSLFEEPVFDLVSQALPGSLNVNTAVCWRDDFLLHIDVFH